MTSNREQFFASDVERICEVKRNRLQTWIERGWIIPSIQKGEGSGYKNIFSLTDLLSISFFKQAIESGISRDAAAKFLEIFQKTESELFPDKEQWAKMLKPVYYLFFRQGKMVSGHSYIRQGQETTFIKTLEATQADDVIGINVSKLRKRILERV